MNHVRSSTSLSIFCARSLCVVALLAVCSTASAQDSEDGPVTFWDGTTEEPVSCKPDIRKEISSKTTSTPELVKLGGEKYKIICASCHGEKGLADGPAAAALNPKPRNLAKDPYKKGTSVLALYDVVTNGLPGTQMAGFEAALSEKERWAIAHYVQNDFLPKERVEKMTDQQLEDVCVSLSKPPKPPALPVEFAMQLLVEEDAARRDARLSGYGAIKLNDEADKNHGANVWKGACSSCHGDSAQGVEELGRFGRFPYVELSARALKNGAAGGTWEDFVTRVDGFHATIPSMTPTAWLDNRDWKSLQAYMSGLAGGAEVTTDRPPAPKAGLITVTDAYELVHRDGKVFQITHGDEGTTTEVTDYATFRGLYKPVEPPADGAEPEALPEEAPADGLNLKVLISLGCAAEEKGCGPDALKAEVPAVYEERTISF